jgi:hypothetical protein
MSGWIGVDLDCTLAQYGGWVDELHIGEPIGPMVLRVKQWIKEGIEVRIFTARMHKGALNLDGSVRDIEPVRKAIQDWTEKHIGHRLAVTNEKDYGMLEFWDDRAVRVRPNTGYPCCNVHRDL